MYTQFRFTVSGLLIERDKKISGPMSPVLFMKEMARLIHEPYNRLARVDFEDPLTLQVYEGPELTGYDHLILGVQHANDLYVTFWIDLGSSGLPVGMGFQSDREVTITPVFRKRNFEVKPTDDEIQQILYHVFDHPEVLNIKPSK